MGHTCGIRSAWDWNAQCFEPEFEAVAIFGLHGRGPQIREAYERAGVPVVIIDFGYMRRVNNAHSFLSGHWQVSLGGLNRPPPFDCDGSRFDALELDVAERGGDPGGYTLICTQTTGDASHGMTEEQIQAWVTEQIEKWPNAQVRPHPLQSHLTYRAPICQAADLSSALAAARRVVVANSNTGVEALLAGVPVTATMPSHYSEACGPLPSMADRMRLFRRLAWGQWTWDEFRRGLPQRFLMDCWMPYSLQGATQAAPT